MDPAPPTASAVFQHTTPPQQMTPLNRTRSSTASTSLPARQHVQQHHPVASRLNHSTAASPLVAAALPHIQSHKKENLRPT